MCQFACALVYISLAYVNKMLPKTDLTLAPWESVSVTIALDYKDSKR